MKILIAAVVLWGVILFASGCANDCKLRHYSENDVQSLVDSMLVQDAFSYDLALMSQGDTSHNVHEPDSNNLSGTWNFHYFDVNGTHYHWSTKLKHENDVITGATSINGWLLIQSHSIGDFSIDGHVRGDSIELDLTSANNQIAPLRLKGTKGNTAGRFYQSLFGTSHPTDSTRMRGGVWIAYTQVSSKSVIH